MGRPGSQTCASRRSHLAEVRALADNIERVTALALTPTYVFYAGDGNVYGVSRHKASGTCGQNGELCPAVLVQDGEEIKPTAMLWDGDLRGHGE